MEPELDPTTGTPLKKASTMTRPNCSFHVGVLREGTTRQSMACRTGGRLRRSMAPRKMTSAAIP
jgi:hypothetical protein